MHNKLLNETRSTVVRFSDSLALGSSRASGLGNLTRSTVAKLKIETFLLPSDKENCFKIISKIKHYKTRRTVAKLSYLLTRRTVAKIFLKMKPSDKENCCKTILPTDKENCCKTILPSDKKNCCKDISKNETF